VSVRFGGFPYLLVWQKYGAPYICVEPWCGLPDFTDASGKLADKAGIIIAAPGETVVRTHTIRPL
jgi:galactose mutarotase-like enzyme